MRVLQLVTQARGGPVDHAVEVAIELARRGHDSHLVGPPSNPLDVAAAHGVDVHLAHMAHKRDLRGARDVARAVARVRPDVLHLQDRRAGLVGRTLPAARAIGSVYTLHGVPDQLASLVPGNLPVAAGRVGDRARYLHAERWLARSGRSAVVVPCDALATYVREQVRLPDARVHSIPNGVGRAWLDGAAGGAATQSRPARPLGVPVTVTWLGLMQPVKRVGDLVTAVGRIPGLRLELVGDGPERPRIEAAVAQRTHAHQVQFAGFRADVAPYLRRTDLLALPSAAEACPMVLLQAMASGVPVVATRVGGVPEIVRDGVDGVLVDAGDVDQLAGALAKLAADPALRRRMGINASTRVAERFGIDRNVTALLDVYAEVAR